MEHTPAFPQYLSADDLSDLHDTPYHIVQKIIRVKHIAWHHTRHNARFYGPEQQAQIARYIQAIKTYPTLLARWDQLELLLQQQEMSTREQAMLRKIAALEAMIPSWEGGPPVDTPDTADLIPQLAAVLAVVNSFDRASYAALNSAMDDRPDTPALLSGMMLLLGPVLDAAIRHADRGQLDPDTALIVYDALKTVENLGRIASAYLTALADAYDTEKEKVR